MQKYDLAVVGAGLGGLSAAALAAKSGKKTIVFDPADNVKASLGTFTKEGFTFCPGPVLSFGFERDGAFQRLSENLGIAYKAALQSPCYQVALPDRRITVYAEHSETMDELRREFPGDIDSITRCYRELRKQAVQNSKSSVSAFFSSRRSTKGFIKSFRFSREFMAFLDVQSFYFFNCPAAALPQQSLITLIDSTPLTVQGGFVKLAEQLVDVLLKHRGEIRCQTPLSDIVLKKGGIRAAEQEIQADFVLFNVQNPSPESMVCVGIREDVVPVGMLSEVLCVSDYARPDRFYTLSISLKDDANRAPHGARALSASFSPFEQSSIEERTRQISGLIPFLNDFLVFADECCGFSRVYDAPKNMNWKQVRTRDNGTLLAKSSGKGIYLLRDRAGTPVQAIAAAQQFIQRMA